MRTKLKRRLSAEDRSLTPRSRLLAVAMIEKPGLAKTMLSPVVELLSSSGTEMYFSERMEIRASWTSLVERVSSSKRPMAPVSMAVMIGEGIIDSRDWPLAMTMETFQEYLMWSSVVPAVPWTTRVELREIAAESSSASQLLPVPGSPMSSRPRSEARVTMERSTKLRSPNHFCAISRSRPSERSEPRMNRRIIFGDRRQEKGLGLSSTDSSQSSSSAYLISAGARSRSDISEALSGEKRLEFVDKLADVAGDHRRAEVFEALTEPRVDGAVAGAVHRADRDELGPGAVDRGHVLEELLDPCFVEVRDPHHGGAARLGDLRLGHKHGDHAVVAAAKLGAQQGLEGVVHPGREVERLCVVGDQVDVHLRQPGEDRREDGAVHHRVGHRAGLVDNDNQPLGRRLAGGVPVVEAIDVQPLLFRTPVGEVLPDRAVEVEVAEHPLGRDRAVDSADRRFLHLGAQHLGDLVDVPADQGLRVGQGHARQVALVPQQLLDQRHARGQLCGERRVGEHFAQLHPLDDVGFERGKVRADRRDQLTEIGCRAVPAAGALRADRRHRRSRAAPPTAQFARLTAERSLQPARVGLPPRQLSGGDRPGTGVEDVEQHLRRQGRAAYFGVPVAGAVGVWLGDHQAVELGGQFGVTLDDGVDGRLRVKQCDRQADVLDDGDARGFQRRLLLVTEEAGEEPPVQNLTAVFC